MGNQPRNRKSTEETRGGEDNGKELQQMKTATATFALPPLLQHQCSVTVFSRQSLSPPKTQISFPRYRRRYSNTRTFRNQNTSNFRYGGDDDDDDDDKGDFGRRRRRRRPWLSGEPLSKTDQDSGIVGEFIDSVWILKVIFAMLFARIKFAAFDFSHD